MSSGAYGAVAAAPPPRLLVEDQFIEEDEVLRNKTPKIQPSLSPQLLATAQGDSPYLPLCHIPPLQQTGHCRLIYQYSPLGPRPGDHLRLVPPPLRKQEFEEGVLVGSRERRGRGGDGLP